MPALAQRKCSVEQTTSPLLAEEGNLNSRRTRSVSGKIPLSLHKKSDHGLTIDTQVIIWDDAKQKVVITLEFHSRVHRVCLSRSRIIAVLQNSVHMYAFSSPPQKISVFETADNPFGICCLGAKVIVFPGRTPGQVQMVEMSSGNISIIPAHGTPLKAMTLSPDGEILATASETVRSSLYSQPYQT
ncbi:MAG: hypothetical protein Q9167_008063 [Letrouitia subvulpina]